MKIRHHKLYGKLITEPCFEEVPTHEAQSKYIPHDYNSSEIGKVAFSFAGMANRKN